MQLANVQWTTILDRSRWPIGLALAAAGFMAVASLGGVLLPATYANEAPGWAVQALAQDWFDLVVVCPLLLAGAILSLRGSAIATSVLTGGVLFVVYSFLIYTFDVHFNALFLVYCATLGLAGYSLIGLVAGAMRPPLRELQGRGTARFTGWLLVAVAALFAALWLKEIVPAIMSGSTPDVLRASGLPTNPVQVIDLSFFLPAQAMVGASLLRRRPLGFALAPALLVFGVLMSALIVINQVLALPQAEPGAIVAPVMLGLVLAAYLAALVPVVRSMRR